MDKKNANIVARAMCKASYILWDVYKGIIVRESENPKVTILADRDRPLRFNTRVGTGKSTYCRFERASGTFILNYGWKMIADKCTNPTQLKRWTTGKEIAKLGYMGGDASLINTIVHTVVHEFGHVWQDSRHEVKDRSVHNAAFYEILDRMYEDDHWKTVQLSIESDLALFGVVLAFDNDAEVVPSWVEKKGDFKKGDRISFVRKRTGEKSFAIIKRVNKKTVSVVACDKAGSSFRGTVPYSMLDHAPLEPRPVIIADPPDMDDPWAVVQATLRCIK